MAQASSSGSGSKQWFSTNRDVKTSIQDGVDVVDNMTADIMEDSYQQVITDELMWHLNLYVIILLCSALAVFGSLNNVVNMVIFYRLGLKDSMAVCLFALSFTDFLLCFLVGVCGSFYIWDTFFPTNVIDPMALNYVGFVWVSNTLFHCSGWITAFLAVERCVCVTFPFNVRAIFTRDRCITFIVIIYVVTTVAYVPVYATQWLDWLGSGAQVANESSYPGRRLVVQFSKNRKEVEFLVEVLSVAVLSIPAIATIMVSVLWMTYGLYVSSRIRRSLVSENGSESRGDQRYTNLHRKTKRLSKVVLLLAIIFTVTSVPRFNALFMGFFDPDVNEGGRERNLYFFQWQFVRFASIINGSVNILIYLKINSSFREMFQELFPCTKTQNETCDGWSSHMNKL